MVSVLFESHPRRRPQHQRVRPSYVGHTVKSHPGRQLAQYHRSTASAPESKRDLPALPADLTDARINSRVDARLFGTDMDDPGMSSVFTTISVLNSLRGLAGVGQ